MFENLNYASDLMAGLWITGIVCFVSMTFPALLYWVLQVDWPFANASDPEAALSAEQA